MKLPIVPVRGLVAILLMLALVTGWAAESSAPPSALTDVNARDDSGNTPLHVAALRGDAAAVEALLEHKADAGATNHAGATPLHYGTANERIVTALLAKGAPADVVSKFGITPLLTAAARPGSVGIARRRNKPVAASASEWPIGPLAGAHGYTFSETALMAARRILDRSPSQPPLLRFRIELSLSHAGRPRRLFRSAIRRSTMLVILRASAA